jgi:hypothetical protein
METVPALITGSSDIGNIDHLIPAFHPMVSIGRPFILHTPEFGSAMTDALTHAAVVKAAQLLITLVFRLYGDPPRLEEVRRQHRSYRDLA